MTWYAGVGLLLMVVSETATLARIEPFWSWNTPIAWTGFILFADGIVFRARGHSWLTSAPREFAFLAMVSIPLWLVFEFYNRFIDNWHYVDLPEKAALRYLGYAWSFATIWPAIFENAELVAVCRNLRREKVRLTASAETTAVRRSFSEGGGVSEGGSFARRRKPDTTYGKGRFSPGPRALPGLSMAAGAVMLVVPLLWPSRYLAAPVWLGFIFLLDPINARLGGQSLAADLRNRQHDRLVNLMLSGLLCGVLWEFWNYWSRAQWHYTVPIMENVKIFEMPLLGYFGFPVFALECFTMYVFIRQMYVSLMGGLGRTGPRQLGRTIAL